jgi:hypothetical protein
VVVAEVKDLGFVVVEPDDGVIMGHGMDPIRPSSKKQVA